MMRCLSVMLITFFFFQAEDGIRDVAVTGVQTCALPIFFPSLVAVIVAEPAPAPLTRPLPSTVTAELLLAQVTVRPVSALDRKSTRLNSSHGYISYAVFCLKKKKIKKMREMIRTSTSTTTSMLT